MRLGGISGWDMGWDEWVKRQVTSGVDFASKFGKVFFDN